MSDTKCELSLQGRTSLAGRLRDGRESVAISAMDDYFGRHPDLAARWGDRGRKLSNEDAAYHVDFLAGATESGSLAAFDEYVRWTCRMLAARGVPPAVVRESLGLIEAHLPSGFEAGERAWLSALFEAGRAATGAPLDEPAPPGAGPLSVEKNLYLRAVLDGHRKAALAIALEAVQRGHVVPDVYVEVLQDALYEVGRLWEVNTITVADEHMATAITQYVAAQLYERLPQTSANRGKMVLTGVEGELHQVGANMVADVLEADGWDVRFLGSDTPAAGVLRAIEEHRPDVVGISCTLLFSIPKVVSLIAAIRALPGPGKPRIVLGGGAFRSSPHLCQDLGADGWAPDLREAVTLARRLASA